MNRPEHQAAKDVAVDSESDPVSWTATNLGLERPAASVSSAPRSREGIGSEGALHRLERENCNFRVFAGVSAMIALTRSVLDQARTPQRNHHDGGPDAGVARGLHADDGRDGDTFRMTRY